MEKKFKKYVFGISLNNISVAKYLYQDGSIEIVAEGSGCAKGRIFKSEELYDEWIDRLVDDETAIFNKAKALDIVIDALNS